MMMPPWPIQREVFSLTAPLLQTLHKDYHVQPQVYGPLPTPFAPLILAWPTTLPLAKQIARQSGVPKVVGQAT